MRIVLFAALLFIWSSLAAQSPDWRIDPYEDRYFVENIGQFDDMEGKPVFAGVDNKGTEIFYTSAGFTYRFRKPVAVPRYMVEKESEDEPDNEKEDLQKIIYDTLQISAEWLGASAAAIRLDSLQTPLFHYAANGGQLVGARSYSALKYNGLYDGIDLEYTFHASEGIKYSLTVKPGANAANIALAFAGADEMFLDSEGNLHATLGDAALIDHAPTAYLLESGDPVDIRFELVGNVLRFEVADYDHAQTLFIDPWIINPGFTAQGKVFDVGWDCSGNIYAFGGSSPWKVKKFTSAGALVWNYNTNHTDWYGDMITDDLGNVYIIEGCCDGNREKLNSSGIVQWTVNNGVYEFWRLAFSCDFSRLSMATAYSASAILVPANSISTVNLTTGALTGAVVVSGSEPRAFEPAASGNYYVLTAVGNEFLGRNNTYGPIYNVGNGYSLLYNGPLYANGTNTTSGINGLAVYGTFAFTTNGVTLMKRNLATGALITSVAIPGGTAEQYSGVAVDNCGNVFVGSNNNVYQYDVNLAPTATIPIAGAIYDVAVSGTAQLLVAGNGVLASQTAPCVAPCHTCIILPQGLSDWNAQVNTTNQVELSWENSNPNSEGSYTVERSADSRNYAPMETRSADQTQYSLLDIAPLKGYSWYRLAHTDAAGTVTYAPAKQVWIADQTPSLSVYPNPAQDWLRVQLPQAEGESILQVINAQGSVVMATAVLGTQLAESFQMDVSDLETGIYTLRILGMQAQAVKFCRMDF